MNEIHASIEIYINAYVIMYTGFYILTMQQICTNSKALRQDLMSMNFAEFFGTFVGMYFIWWFVVANYKEFRDNNGYGD